MPNRDVPCDQDFDFVIRAFGLSGRWTRSHWTPPACIVTTPAPTTSTTTTEATTTEYIPEETTPDLSAQMADIQAENDRLQAKIDGLKQEYEKIGLQVFFAFKQSFFQGLEDFLARRKSEVGESDSGGGGGLFGGGSNDVQEEPTTPTPTDSYDYYGNDNTTDSGSFWG